MPANEVGMDQRKATEELILAGARLYREGLISGSEGNISSRLNDNRVLITASGKHLGNLKADDFITLDLEGTLLSGEGQASSESAAHLATYNTRPDVGAVVHAHPSNLIAITLAGIDFEGIPLPELVYAFGSVPTCRFAVPGTEEGGEVVAEWIADRDALLLDRHGALTVGADIARAVDRMEMLEAVARVVLLAKGLAGFEPLTPKQVENTIEAAIKAGATPDAINAWASQVPKLRQ